MQEIFILTNSWNIVFALKTQAHKVMNLPYLFEERSDIYLQSNWMIILGSFPLHTTW